MSAAPMGFIERIIYNLRNWWWLHHDAPEREHCDCWSKLGVHCNDECIMPDSYFRAIGQL